MLAAIARASSRSASSPPPPRSPAGAAPSGAAAPASARLAAMAAARSSSSSPPPAGGGAARVRSATSVPACAMHASSNFDFICQQQYVPACTTHVSIILGFLCQQQCMWGCTSGRLATASTPKAARAPAVHARFHAASRSYVTISGPGQVWRGRPRAGHRLRGAARAHRGRLRHCALGRRLQVARLPRAARALAGRPRLPNAPCAQCLLVPPPAVSCSRPRWPPAPVNPPMCSTPQVRQPHNQALPAPGGSLRIAPAAATGPQADPGAP